MSIQLTIFVPKPAHRWTARELRQFIQDRGFDLEIEGFVPGRQAGTIPCTYKGLGCGIEYYRETLRAYLQLVLEMKEEEPDEYLYSDADLERIRSDHHVVQLVTHSSPRSRVSAVIFGACLAAMTGGWLLDEPVWTWVSPDAAVEWARDMEIRRQADVEAEGS